MKQARDATELRLENFGVETLNWRSELVSLRLQTGNAAALVGGPGSGKSLIFEAVAQIHRPGVSTVGKNHGSSPSLLPQDARLSALPTDEVWSLLGLNGWALGLGRTLGIRPQKGEREQEAERLLSRLRLPPSRVIPMRFRSLSTAERRRVLLCSVLLRKPRFLLFDGWNEMMDNRDRLAISAVLDEELANGLAILASARSSQLPDFPSTQVIQLQSPEIDDEQAVPLVPRSGGARRHDHALLELNRITVSLGRKGLIRARPAATVVDGASLFVRHGECLVLLGGSGSGKTTLLHTISGLHRPSSGTIRVSDHDVTHAKGARATRLRQDVQLVFQNAQAVLESKRSVRAHLEEARSLAIDKPATAAQWLEKLGLSPRLLSAPAGELSISESQRVDLARSLMLSPKLVLFDAPQASAADTDNGMLIALISTEKAKGTAFLIATSDPAIAESLADRVAVIHAGRVIELGTRSEILGSPAHPASQALIQGKGLLSPSDPTSPRLGCPYVSECPKRELPLCDQKEPMLAPLLKSSSGTRRVACFHPNKLETAL